MNPERGSEDNFDDDHHEDTSGDKRDDEGPGSDYDHKGGELDTEGGPKD